MVHEIRRCSGAQISWCLALTGLTVFTDAAFAQQGLQQGMQPTQSTQAPALRWNSGMTQRIESMTPRQTQSKLGQLVKKGERSHILVHFKQGLTQSQRERLSDLGLALQSPL